MAALREEEGKRHPCEKRFAMVKTMENQFQDRKLIGRIPGVFHRAAKYTPARYFRSYLRPWFARRCRYFGAAIGISREICKCGEETGAHEFSRINKPVAIIVSGCRSTIPKVAIDRPIYRVTERARTAYAFGRGGTLCKKRVCMKRGNGDSEDPTAFFILFSNLCFEVV